MSASNNKKFRKEQDASKLTQKQKEQKKEDRKLKVYTVSFIVVILAIVLIFVGNSVIGAVNRSGYQQKRTIAATIGDRELNSVEMSYYFHDMVNSAYSQWSSAYGDYTAQYLESMGLDVSKPLTEQSYGEEDGTWADYFMDSAVERAKGDYALYDKAISEGFKLSEEDEQAIQSTMSDLTMYSQMYGYSDTNDYLANIFGYGSDEESYEEHCRISAIAAAYYNAHQDSLTYDDAAIRAQDEKDSKSYSSYSYAYYYSASSSYLEGGTEADDGTKTYTEEEKSAAAEKAKADADSLATAETLEQLNAAIAALPVNKDNSSAAAARNDNVLYSNLSTTYNEWLSDASRVENDITCIPDETKITDESGTEATTVNGYYVVMFLGSKDNKEAMANFQDITVAFEHAENSGTKVTFTDEEKAAARKNANDLLAKWKAGEMTEDTFTALANDDEIKSTCALHENVSPDSMEFVSDILDWALSADRKPGETTIIESVDGYHILYFVGVPELNYRDYMITNYLRNTDMDEWYNGILEPITAEKKDTSKIRMNLVLSNGM